MTARIVTIISVILSVFICKMSVAGTDHQPTGYQKLFEMREGRLPASSDDVDDSTGYDVYHYNLEIRFDPSDESVDGHVDMSLVATDDQLTEIYLNLRNNMSVDAVQVEGVSATWSFNGTDNLIIDLPQALNSGDSATVGIDYHGQPVQGGSLGALFWDTHSGTEVVASLSEPDGARTWWPCKDMSADKATARMVWTVPDWMKATGNGTLQSVSVPEPGWRSYEWVENYPITTYLIAVSATNYAYWRDWYVNAVGDSMPVDYYIYPEDSTNSIVDFVDIPDMIAYYASIYGEYPFIDEKYGQVAFPFGGAMEHQTLTSMGSWWINGWGPSYNNWIYAHELAHQWWGDLVTCATWADIWLNEGFATYSDALWAGASGGPQAFADRMDDFYWEYIQGEPGEGRFPIYDPEYMWGVTVYQKGAWILNMIRYVIGEDDFWDFFPEWGERYGYDVAETADLQQTLEDVSGEDLDWFFNQWVYMAGYPEYEWGWRFEPYGFDSSRVDISIIQTQSTLYQTPEVFVMPIEIGVTTSVGYEVHTVQNDLREQNFSFFVQGVPLSVSFDPDNWILKTAEMTGYVGVEPASEPDIPSEFVLLGVYPNPFNPTTVISFLLPEASRVTLDVFDVNGRLIPPGPGDSPFIEYFSPGAHQILFDGSNLSSGIYFYRLRAGKWEGSGKLLLLK